MSIIRFGVSLEARLLSEFDSWCRKNKYENRSEAIRDLIRGSLVSEEWESSKGDVTAVITIVYDHHKRELMDGLVDVQHDHQDMVIASQHVHLDHNNCLEVIIVRGSASHIKELASRLHSAKGVKHGELVKTTTGRYLK